MERVIVGNYELNLTASVDAATVWLSGAAGSSCRSFLDISRDRVDLGRVLDGKRTVWKSQARPLASGLEVRVLKKGNFTRYWVNETTGWIRGPLGEWEGIYEPVANVVGVEAADPSAILSCRVTRLPWLQQVSEPAIALSPRGGFYEKQIIPGAILEVEGGYYMYCMAGMEGAQEGSSRRTVAVAHSDDLVTWRVHPEPVITYEDRPYDNLYVNGAVIAPDGRVALMVAAQVFPEWKGFMLATADDPLGPFEWHAGNPVYRHFTTAHEFDLIHVDGDGYIMFYAGFTPEAQAGPPGDRGYLLYSDDLKHWREDPRNPVFAPQTPDDWDAVHVRPRSLNRLGDMWYLWYEGCNDWTPPTDPDHHGWWDTVGLARSADLAEWEHYPRNPALPGMGVGAHQFDGKWTGWPRMVVKDGAARVFYTGDGQVGVRTIDVGDLTDWSSEGGETIDLLADE